MLSSLFNFTARCPHCNLILLKTDPGVIQHGSTLFCNADCADAYWLSRRSRNAA